jgi:arabinoxylan arabinofuranohydrolase
MNPYLPGNEYIPDAEPRLFGDRVYIYGSHDRFGGVLFCLNDYVCYSAPADDLTEWRFEGTIFRKNQDPRNRLGLRLLFAPDVVQGPDGRFYLYYALDFMGLMGVAVADVPAGPFTFLGHVHFADGRLWGRRTGDPFPFDPGVLVDGERVFLYSGFALDIPAVFTGGKKLASDGGVVLELETDMVTVKSGPKMLFPKAGPGAFPGHEFFEASSIRKIDGRYCFVYSSRHNHELCHAVSDRPDGGFEFAGTLVSQGDVFLGGRTEAEAVNYLGNTHGGILEVNGRWFVFYHRQTNRHSYSRQACAEPLVGLGEGRFAQAEVTSTGLRGLPFPGTGRFEARTACHLWSKDGVGRYDGPAPRKHLAAHPYFTQHGRDGDPKAVPYLANLREGAVAGFKSFRFAGPGTVRVTVRGRAEGRFEVSTSPDFTSLAATLEFTLADRRWTEVSGAFTAVGVCPLYFRYRGTGGVDFRQFELTGQPVHCTSSNLGRNV